MAGSFSDFTEEGVLNHIFKGATFASPTIYVGLSTTSVTDAGGGVTEPSGNGYARVATATSDWNNAIVDGAGYATTNANDVTFPTATGSWGTITDVAIYDAATGGNVIAYADLTSSKAVDSGDTAKFNGGAPGAIKVTLV